MGQITQQLANTQAPGTLPDATITNPRDNHIVNAVVTRSSKLAENVEKEEIKEEGLLEVEL